MDHPVLLVVDVQQELVRKNPWRKIEVLDTIRRLLAGFRERGQEVIFVRHDDGEGSELSRGSEGWEIAREVAPTEGERIFDKTRNSAFLGTGLGEYLKEQGADTLVLVGMQTELCIDATLKSAFDRGFRILIPTDGCTTFDNEMITAAELNRLFYYKIWKNRFGEIMTPEEVEKEALV